MPVTCPKCGGPGYYHDQHKLWRCKATDCGECWPAENFTMTALSDMPREEEPPPVFSRPASTEDVAAREAIRRKRQKIQADLAETRAGIVDAFPDVTNQHGISRFEALSWLDTINEWVGRQG